MSVLAILCFILLIVVAACICGSGGVFGGGRTPRRLKNEHIVVDTLNLAHHIGRPPKSARDIAAVIDATSATLRRAHPGRVMYALKDRESVHLDADARDVFRAAAERNKVYVIAAERYLDGPRSTKSPSPQNETERRAAEHAARGRDDFLASVLASRWKCAVLTDDRMHDFDLFRSSVAPFHTIEFAFWRSQPLREFYRADSLAYARLRRPPRIGPDAYAFS